MENVNEIRVGTAVDAAGKKTTFVEANRELRKKSALSYAIDSAYVDGIISNDLLHVNYTADLFVTPLRWLHDYDVIALAEIITVSALKKYYALSGAAYVYKLYLQCINGISEVRNQLMCLKTALDLGINPDSIAKTYYLQDAAEKVKMGKTPTSNTQLCKLLQQCVDSILTNIDEKGEAIYKVNNHDVAYLNDLYGKKGRDKLQVKVSNDSFCRRLLVDICYRLITNSKYGIGGFKTIDNAK